MLVQLAQNLVALQRRRRRKVVVTYSDDTRDNGDDLGQILIECR